MPSRVRASLSSLAELFLFESREVDLLAALRILRSDFSVKRLVCEGGGTLLRSLAALDLVDAIRLTVAPVVFGGKSAPTLTGRPGSFLHPLREFRIVRHVVVGNESCIELRRKWNCGGRFRLMGMPKIATTAYWRGVADDETTGF